MMHLMIPHHLHVQTPPSEEDDPMDALDRVKEILADGDHPFPVDRRILKEVIRSKLGQDVQRVKFLSSGTFHKAFVVLFADGEEVVMRIARRFMPRIKTESEVATLDFIRTRTNVPVPEVYHYESNPYNDLEAEYIIMSKAKGVPLQRVYREMDTEEKRKLFSNLAGHMLTLFKHRFNAIGSLYSSRNPAVPPSVPQTPAVSRPGTPRVRSRSNLGTRPPISRMSTAPSPVSSPTVPYTPYDLPISFKVGPMVSWPFFGEGRGLQDMNRGPWSSFESYLVACCEREVEAVRREAEGRATAHRPHRPPEAGTSAPPSSDEDDEDDGEIHYRDYRTMQRSSLLVSYAIQRVQAIQYEMDQFKAYLRKLGVGALKRDELDAFSFDLHDLSLSNIFVDQDDPTEITCIIDWESTCIRPLWQWKKFKILIAI
ncbi:hypothetical protein FRC20_004541 [Serendipita sp. 405]|nr:hypothetical protein FRC20_004541 [Serendipita sp. 405]